MEYLPCAIWHLVNIMFIYIYVDGKHMGHVIWLICHCYGDAMGSFWLNEN